MSAVFRTNATLSAKRHVLIDSCAKDEADETKKMHKGVFSLGIKSRNHHGLAIAAKTGQDYSKKTSRKATCL